jgi:hypothetical protein
MKTYHCSLLLDLCTSTFNHCVHVRVFISRNAHCVLQILAIKVDGYDKFGANHGLSKYGPEIHHLGHQFNGHT